MLKQDYLKRKTAIGLMKYELVGQIMKEFVGLIAKAYRYLKDKNDEDKKAKGAKTCVTKRKLKFQDYTSCLEAVQIENKISHLGKNKLDVNSLQEDQKEFIKNNKLVDSLKEDQKEFIKNNKLIDSLKEDQKEFIKNNKLILKTQQRSGL